MRFWAKQGTCRPFLVFLLVMMCACGREQDIESDANLEADAQVPVAEFQDMKLPVPLDTFRFYTSNAEWFYAVSVSYDREKQKSCWNIYRGRVADEWEAQEYVTKEDHELLTLLADRQGNCYLYMRAENGTFFLEKYNADGEQVWHSDHTASQLANKGERLTDGIVTQDGRVILYDYGVGGSAFAFGVEGSLQGMFTPDVECLEGIAEGREGRLYGYCLTGEEPTLVDIGDAPKRYVCPITPLQVYGGGEDGVYLCTGEGLWKYDPETGETKRLWMWDDEYVQIDESQVCRVSRGAETIDLACIRPSRKGISWKGEQLTFVSVGYENYRDYPEKQTVTISRSFYQKFEEYSAHHMEELVRQYNRQSRKYKVVILLPEADMISGESRDEFFGELEMQLMRGEGPDLIEVQGLNVDDLAAKGAIEDLTGYYASSEVIGDGDILEQVREAGRILGRDMVVIPAFSLGTMRSREKVDAADWTPLRFLEMAQGNGGVTYPDMSQSNAFWHCMGVSLGGHFVDYERRECYFDSEDFRRVLEGCFSWESEPPPPTIRAGSEEEIIALVEEYAAQEKYEEREWQLQTASISTMFDILQYDEKEAYWLGYPGWNGAETELNIMDGFVMNSASENKEGAWDFLEFLLSEELQSSIDWGFPARRDSFEEYLNHSYVRIEDVSPEFGYYADHAQTPAREDFDRIWEMLDRAVYRPAGFYFIDDPIRVILEEETGMYFAGDATLEETVEKLQNRVTLYLNEM